MNPYQETHATWNKLAEQYEAQFMDMEIYDESYERFCAAIEKEDASILEVGCGPGNVTRRLVKAKPEWKILATDISPRMLELAKKANPTIETGVLDARDLSDIEGRFDGLVCGFVIPYLSLEDVTTFLKTTAEKLTEGGVLYLSFVPGDPSKSGFVTGSMGHRSYFYYHAADDMLDKLKASGFEVTSSEQVNYTRSNGEVEEHLVVIASLGSGEQLIGESGVGSLALSEISLWSMRSLGFGVTPPNLQSYRTSLKSH